MHRRACRQETKEHPMSAPTTGTSDRRTGNDGEIVTSMTRGPKFPLATGDEDVEGHRLGGTDPETDSMTRGPKFPLVTGDDDATTPDGAARR
jgi:hypothetical protein